jgi:hypothetical protein
MHTIYRYIFYVIESWKRNRKKINEKGKRDRIEHLENTSNS